MTAPTASADFLLNLEEFVVLLLVVEKYVE